MKEILTIRHSVDLLWFRQQVEFAQSQLRRKKKPKITQIYSFFGSVTDKSEFWIFFRQIAIFLEENHKKIEVII